MDTTVRAAAITASWTVDQVAEWYMHAPPFPSLLDLDCSALGMASAHRNIVRSCVCVYVDVGVRDDGGGGGGTIG